MTSDDSDDGLFGPDISDAQPETVVIDVDNPDDVWLWQFCNRWVFLKHQRPMALRELRDFVAGIKKA